MDPRRFDRIAYVVGASSSRRQALKMLAAGALGGRLGARARPAGAACGLVGESCAASGDCCANARCTRRRVCACRDGFTACAGRCRDLQTGGNNCGRCGRACPADHVCRSGRCEQCPTGAVRCAERCVDPLTDREHCGACGNACGDGQSCCGGTCRTTATDPNNCGTCGRSCPAVANATRTCQNSVCGFSCNLGFFNSNGKCCPTGYTNCGGTCVPHLFGYVCCGGTMVNLTTDERNCGACGRVCPTLPAHAHAFVRCENGWEGHGCYYHCDNEHCDSDGQSWNYCEQSCLPPINRLGKLIR